MIARAIPTARLVVQHRNVLARLCAVGGLALLILSAYWLRPIGFAEIPDAVDAVNGEIVFSNLKTRVPTSDDGLSEAVAALVAGGLLLGASLALTPDRVPLARPTAGTQSFHRTRRIPLAIGIALLAITAEASGQWLPTDLLYDVPSHLQFALLSGGIACTAWGAAGTRWRLPHIPRLDAALMLGLFGVALALRTWALGDTIHMFVDELNFASAVRRFWFDNDINMLTPITNIIAFPKLYTYLEAQSVAVVGRNLTGLRLPSAILGALTIPALYALARTLFDRPTAVIAGALLATFPPHLHFSRLALNNVADPLFGTLALTFLARGLRTRQRTDFALAGVALGLTQYFYEGGRFVFPALVIAWLVAGVLLWRQRPPGRGVALMLITAIIVAAPVYYTMAARERPFAPRVEGTALNEEYWRDVLVSSPGEDAFERHVQHVKETFLVYVHRPEGSFFYAGDTPLVLVYLVPALLAGAALALWRLRAYGMLLPLLWVAGTSIGNSLLVGNIDAPRYVVAFPALALLCAIGLRHGLALVWPDGARPRVRGLVVVGLVVALAAVQTSYYFGAHVERFSYQLREVKPYRDGEDAMFRAASFPPHTHIYLISEIVYHQPYARDVLEFLSDDLTVETLSRADVDTEFLWNIDRSVDNAFFLEPDDLATVGKLQSFVAISRPLFTSHDIARDKQYVLYYAPAFGPNQNAPTDSAGAR